jgi:hypothetical protein
MKKGTDGKRALRKLAKSNPAIDERVVIESMELVAFARRFHHKGTHRFGILPSSESSLKVKPPILHVLG